MTLNELGKKYGTDKSSNDHDYLKHYEKHLPKNPKKLLEIGAYKGASLLMWREYFPHCDIHTIDIFEGEEDKVTEQWCKNNNIIPHRGDQKDLVFLSGISGGFDVIIDDGSHNSYDQLLSFNYLFRYNLNSGGLYVIEDLHACNEPFYWGNTIKSFEETLLYYLAEPSASNALLSKEMRSYLEKIYIFHGKIAFVWKK